jgi:hypothetical protein
MIGKNSIKFHLPFACQLAICSKDKASDKIAKVNIKKVNNNSRLIPITNTRVEDIIAYLLFDVYPTKISKYEKADEIRHKKITLYSISQIAKFGIQTIFAQNK